MILIVHKDAKINVRVIKDDKEIPFKNLDCVAVFWELAESFPDEIIGWCEERNLQMLNNNGWGKIFHHDLIMASYAIETVFLPEEIGYVDQLPFVNVNRKVLYGTWQMSTDIGGIKGKVLRKFYPLLRSINDFGYLINSIAKVGQQNSLFCYSAPQLIHSQPDQSKFQQKPTASEQQLFYFVFQHYSSFWTFILFWCLIKYDRKIPVFSFPSSFFQEKFFKKKIDLSGFEIDSTKNRVASETIDVIIPTIGRAGYLYKVLKDFSVQTHLPVKVIIVEQNPCKEAISELNYITEEKWPFKIIHYFIKQTGACNARNIALARTSADWVFLSDDDQRFGKDLIKSIFEEIKKYGVDGLTTSYLQTGEQMTFEVPKQWGTFGAGNSVVLGKFAREAKFLPALEHGYGEDKEYGMQLRNMGCDIIYHPGLEIKHLKAPSGGFRQFTSAEWETEEPLPKPSPTLMVYALKYYTPQQILGFKTSLFLKYYNKQTIKNPLAYLKSLRSRWKKSEEWAGKLMKEE